MNKLISNEGGHCRHFHSAPLPSEKMDAKTLNAAVGAGTWQITSKGKESGAKYLVRSPTVLICVVCTGVFFGGGFLYYLFSSSHICARVVLSSLWADICPLCLINLLKIIKSNFYLCSKYLYLLLNILYTLPLNTGSLFSSCFNVYFYFWYFSSMQLLISHHLSMFICHLCLVVDTVPADLLLVYLFSLSDLMCHRHTCKLRPAGLLLILGPPCESTLSLSLPIILEHYWLLICLSALPQISNVIMKWTKNPLCSYLVIAASSTPFI